MIVSLNVDFNLSFHFGGGESRGDTERVLSEAIREAEDLQSEKSSGDGK